MTTENLLLFIYAFTSEGHPYPLINVATAAKYIQTYKYD